MFYPLVLDVPNGNGLLVIFSDVLKKRCPGAGVMVGLNPHVPNTSRIIAFITDKAVSDLLYGFANEGIKAIQRIEKKAGRPKPYCRVYRSLRGQASQIIV